MSKVIPEGWTEDLLMNLVSAQRGTEPGYEAYCEPEKGVCFLRIGDLSGKTNNSVFTKAKGLLYIGPDDILFALDGSPGLVAKGYSGAISSGIRLVKPKNQKVKKDFLFYALQSPTVQSIVKAYTTGSTILHAGRSLQFITILLPPLPEQRKIAAILSSVDNDIEKTKAVIEQTKVVKKGLMQELLTRGIPGRHKKFKKTSIGEIPEGWEVVKLEKLGVFSSGFTINQDRVPKNNPRPYLRVANVQKGYFLLNEIKFIEATNEEFSSRQIQRNDILILEGHANLNELGRCAVAIDEVIGMTHQNHIHRFSPNLSLCDPNYIAFALSIEQVRRLIELEGGTTSGLHTLNRNSIASVPIALPSLSEQSLITKCILSIHNSFDRNEVFLNHLYNIKSALMQVLLTGEVRVKV